jgi:hypothetical protein
LPSSRLIMPSTAMTSSTTRTPTAPMHKVMTDFNVCFVCADEKAGFHFWAGLCA